MKLRFSPTSPFVRKVRVALIETGLAPAVGLIQENPLDPRAMQASPNPLAKVPCLETDDGMVLYDSPVIVEYLNARLDPPTLIPPAGRAHWDALRRQALADGMMDALVLWFVESLRKPERQSGGWMAHQLRAVGRALDALEAEADGLGGPVDIGRIAIAVAISFYDTNHPDSLWRAARPRLAAWFDAFDRRPSMRETVLVHPRDYRG